MNKYIKNIHFYYETKQQQYIIQYLSNILMLIGTGLLESF